MKNTIIYVLLVFMFVLSKNLFAQEVSHGGKLPWVNGNMPQTNTQGTYKVINVEASTIESAKKLAKEEFVKQLLSEQGVTISSESVITNNYQKKGRNKATGSVEYRDETEIKYGNYKAVFSKVDHYYEYKNSTYHLWVLYLVSEDGKKIGNVPTLAYKVNNGAYRSLLVPGWAQFYTKQPVKGSLFLAGEAALIGGGFYLYNRFQHNDTRANEANSVKIKQEYKKRAKNYKTYSYIAFGAAAGLYIYNVVDAFTSKRGKMTYDYKNMRLAVTPSVGLTEDYYATVGFTIHF